MDIFDNNELRKEEIFGGFDKQSEADDTFALNNQEKYPEELSSLDITPENYSVFSKEKIKVPETEPTIETPETIAEPVAEATSSNDDLFDSMLASEQSDTPLTEDPVLPEEQPNESIDPTASTEEAISPEDLEAIMAAVAAGKKAKETLATEQTVEAESDSDEPVAPREFQEIDNDKDAVEIDINNLYPEHPSKLGLGESKATAANEADGKNAKVDPIDGKPKKLSRKEKKKLRQELEEAGANGEEKEKKKAIWLPLAIAAASILIIAGGLWFAESQFQFVSYTMSKIFGEQDTSKVADKKALQKDATKEQAPETKAIAIDSAAIKDSLNNIKIQDSIKLAALKNYQDSINNVENRRIQDSILLAKAERDKAEKVKAEKEKVELAKKKAEIAKKESKAKADNTKIVANEPKEKKTAKPVEKSKPAEEVKETKTKAKEIKSPPIVSKSEKPKPTKKEVANPVVSQKAKEANLAESKSKATIAPPIEEEYVIQVYSSPSKEDAENWLAKVRKKVGNQASISTQVVRDVKWYRIRFGKYKSRSEAEQAVQQAGFTQCWIDRVK